MPFGSLKVATPAAPVEALVRREGHVDFYGHHPAAGGLFVCGWMAHPWPSGERPQSVAARFAGGMVSAPLLATFYYRDDVERRGIGFVAFIACAVMPEGALRDLLIGSERTTSRLELTPNTGRLGAEALATALDPILRPGDAGSQRRQMFALLHGDAAAEPVVGFVDCYGYHAVAGGWIFSGWVSRGWAEGQAPERIVVSFEDGDIEGDAVAALYVRPDLEGEARGVAVFVAGPATAPGALCAVSFRTESGPAVLYLAPAAPRLREPDLVARLRPLLTQGRADGGRDRLLAVLSRQPYAGTDTLAALTDPVLLEIDEAISCGAEGLVLIGWCLAKPGVLRHIRLRCGGMVAALDPGRSIIIERPDVLAAFAPQHGFDDPRCGFITWLAQPLPPDGRPYLEVETTRREIGFRGLPRPKLDGLAAMTRILNSVDVRYTDVAPAFDRVLGPAIAALNRARLRVRPGVTVVEYGRVPRQPEGSVIVPLHGRLDFVEYQMALFSVNPNAAAIEYIYVLDDPPQRKAALALFASVHARFGIPFRALLLDRNMGFAPANNIGLEYAGGNVVAFLNSDVFPGTPDWLEQLSARLAADPALGAVGGVLLFEDGTVQHRGMQFAPLAEFGNWYFPFHEGKGLRHTPSAALQPAPGITGACLVLPRALALRVGGFDEIYAVGDFEDSDLCLKLEALGLHSAVDPAVQLYHLERQSQAGPAQGWRMNLTLYNAWQHQNRWAGTIAAQLALAQTAPHAAAAA